jgi:hypothetical protein
MTLAGKSLLAALPDTLRESLLEHYTRIARNYVEHRWEPSALNAGKLCEVVYCVVDGATSGAYPAHVSKPSDMVSACRALEQRPASGTRVGDRSLRVLIPRILLGIYEVRNNRGVGHVAGEVDSNQMDAAMVFGSANWIMCELVRIFHKVPLKEAQAVVSALVERRVPEIWEVGGQKRVLTNGLSAREQTLLLLYSEAQWTDAEVLRGWVEYKNITHYREKVLVVLHKARLVEFDQANGRVQLSPKGALEVEDRILPKCSAAV